jgi:hypothetical protein
MDETVSDVLVIYPNSFQLNKHYHPEVIKYPLSKKVEEFLQIDNQGIAKRYCQMYTQTQEIELLKLLQSSPVLFRWSGGDLFHVTDQSEPEIKEKMILIEINSCPSGQKSMPSQNQDGYHNIMRKMFIPLISSTNTEGGLAVLYDKNLMETRAFAEAFADVMNEQVYYVKFKNTSDLSTHVKFVDKQLFVRNQDEQWHMIRAVFRYVTQKPWNRIPIDTRTIIINPIVACLAGGRNKLLASHSYHLFNEKYKQYGIEIRMPETIINVRKEDIPNCIQKLGGMGVIKIPYLNAGQGIYTVVNENELNRFMENIPSTTYHSYIVQSLVGHRKWNTNSSQRYSHIFTMQNEKNEAFVKDLRMQICSSNDGFRPTSIYCRKAREVLSSDRSTISDSWQMLGTNLSVKTCSEDSPLNPPEWTIDSERLIIMNHNDYSGLSIDNFIDAYVQTVLGTLAIDELAQQLIVDDGSFNMNLFKSLDPDDELIDEILP